MTSYKKVSTNIPLREAEMLVRHAIDVDGRQVIPWNTAAPGLYPDEEVVELDSGEQVAVSIEPEWWENNGGLTLHAFARWINEDGSTKLNPSGHHIETSHSASFDHVVLDESHSLEELAVAITAIVLGEPQKGSATIALSAAAEKQSSIRKAIETVGKLSGLRVKL